MKIIDASVALKWFVIEPNGQEAADRILQDIEDNPRAFAVPELFFAEMLHILCRVFKDEGKVKEALSALEDLGFERIGFGHQLLQRAAKLSIKYGVSGYDAVYAASAQLIGGCWYTFDREAHRKLMKLNISTVPQ